MHQETIIVELNGPIRLDRYIKRLFPLITQGEIESNLRKGKIKVNAEKVKSNFRVNIGDRIIMFAKVFDSYKACASKIHYPPSVIALSKKLFSKYFLYSDQHLLAIDKPAGLAVQGGSKINVSIDDALAYLNQTNGTDYRLVHRLDKDTSGVLVISASYDSAIKLGDAFKNKQIRKKYIAILAGIPKNAGNVIRSNIGKVKSGQYEIVQEQENGKLAETFYRVLKKNKQFSLVEFKPTTGRMHQLRVHSKALSCPIVGDCKYGGPACSRMLLHAETLTIPSTIFGQEIRITSKLPKEFSLNNIGINVLYSI
jgi:23S rRNA pseudouridine955/2504/2580 synthase